MHAYYILNAEGEPVRANNITEWGSFFEDTEARRVGFDILSGEVQVSTMFLGLDHSFNGPEPILWETMIFGGKLDNYQERCGGNRDDARRMHDAAVEKANAAYLEPYASA